MNYECPFCRSFRKPRVLRYFPPVRVQCIDCEKEEDEDKFVKDEYNRS